MSTQQGGAESGAQAKPVRSTDAERSRQVEQSTPSSGATTATAVESSLYEKLKHMY